MLTDANPKLQIPTPQIMPKERVDIREWITWSWPCAFLPVADMHLTHYGKPKVRWVPRIDVHSAKREIYSTKDLLIVTLDKHHSVKAKFHSL
jgi:hypothetical protein